MKLNGIFLISAIALVPPCAYADKDTLPVQQRFNQLDTNHDGYISRDEAQADSELSQNWNRADLKATNKIDESEFSAFEQDMNQKDDGPPEDN